MKHEVGQVEGMRIIEAAPRPLFKQHTTDSNRRDRRALVKTLGKRQFKKLYRSAS